MISFTSMKNIFWTKI